MMTSRKKKSSRRLDEGPKNNEGTTTNNFGLILKWFRDIRSSIHSTTTTPTTEVTVRPVPSTQRSHPLCSSEGKGPRKRRKRDNYYGTTAKEQSEGRRRHSFNERLVTPPPIRRSRSRTNGFEGRPPPSTMMPARSTPNLQKSHHSATTTGSTTTKNGDSPPPAPPVRDSSTLKSIKYGPGHEKFPSWPVPAAAAVPQALRAPPSGGSHRSKSWTDHTNYPKEKVVTYTRPYMKRQHSTHTQQKLKTVMERCEKIPPETYDSRYHNHKAYHNHYMVPSPPERDLCQLTQADLEEYARSYQDPLKLTRSGLEELMEYTRNYDSMFSTAKEDEVLPPHSHQKQLSYAQSEGYHSYVSSTDSTSTPFLDRLRRDSEWTTRGGSTNDGTAREGGRDSVVTTTSSGSSSETLKWHGSMSDVSVTSSNPGGTTRQLIAHSARVQTPQRHHSESVLYMSGGETEWKDKESRNNSTNKLKLFPVNTYTVPDGSSGGTTTRTVADRITELEKHRYSYLDPEKRHKVPDPTLKAIQKKALLSFYERHNGSTTNWKSEPHLAPTTNNKTVVSPRTSVQLPSRRASSASDYVSGTTSKRSSVADSLHGTTVAKTKHQYSNSMSSLSADLLVGPIIVGPSISVDDWVPPPALPPKNPQLRRTYPQRVISPPPPSPPTVTEGEVILNNDEPLPPPPPELDSSSNDWQHEFNERLKQYPSPPPPPQTVGLPGTASTVVRSSMRTTRQIATSRPFKQEATCPSTGSTAKFGSFPNQQAYAERSSTKYPPSTGNQYLVQKRVVPSPQQQLQREVPPPLQPRQARVNQSMRGRVSANHAVRASPPKDGDGGGTQHQQREGRSQSMSQSKASYLACRRDRERIVPDAESGSYKRTMSPNGHTITTSTATTTTSTPPSAAPTAEYHPKGIWRKSSIKTNNVIRRSSMNEKPTTGTAKHKDIEDVKDLAIKEGEKPMVLPDVLPMNAILSRSPVYNHNCSSKSSSSSSSTCSSRGSPFTPLKSTTLSNPPLLASCLTTTSISSQTHTSPPIISRRTSPPLKLVPLVVPPPLKLSRTPSSASSSSGGSSHSSPLHTSPLSSPLLEPPQVIEGLQLIQRTEVVLRVNTSTTDASSQTDKDLTPLPSRKKLQEEIECEKLSEDFVNQLQATSSDRLKELLVPGPDYKKPTDYVHGLFKVDVTSRPRPLNSPFSSSGSTKDNSPSVSPPPCSGSTAAATPSAGVAVDSLPSCVISGSSTYFTTSEPKAKFLTRFSQDMGQYVVKDTKDLNLKKEELVSRLDRKLEVLRSEQLVVLDECKINDELGENVEAHIRRLARPHEADKFRLHIEEVGKITSLLLGLSGRLARAENALMGMPEDHPERRILESKRDKLLEQLEEAKKLKECIDRRSVNVSNILYKYLSSEEYTDYDHFINMKAKLIMDSKEIGDKIKLGEEQLVALKETLIVAQ